MFKLYLIILIGTFQENITVHFTHGHVYNKQILHDHDDVDT